MKPSILLALISGAALLGGYFVGQSSTRQSAEPQTAQHDSALPVKTSRDLSEQLQAALDAGTLETDGKFASYEKIDTASDEGIRRLTESILADVESSSRDLTAGERIVFSAWAERDPQAAFNRALSVNKPELLMAPLGFAASAPDPSVLRALIESLPKNLIRSSPYLLHGALESAGQSYGFATAVELALSNPAAQSNIEHIYGQWIDNVIQAKTGIKDVGNFALKQPPKARASLLKTLGSRWSKLDAKAAMRWADSLKDAKVLAVFREAVVAKLLESGDPKAVQYLEQTPGLDLAKTGTDWSPGPKLELPDDVDVLRDFVAKFQGKNKETVLVAAAQKAAKGHPELLGNLLVDVPNGALRTKLAETFGSSIRQNNSMTEEELLGAIAALPDIADQDSALIAAAGARGTWVSFGEKPKIQPGVVLSKLGSLDLHSEAVSSLALDWMFQDKESAVEWMHALPEGEAKFATMAKLMPRLAAESDEALAWVRSLPESDQRTEMFKEAATWKAMGDYEKGLLWAQGLPEADRHIAASAAIENMAANSEPDAAANIMTKWLSEIDPTINASEHAQKAAEDIAAIWASRAPTNARDWVNALPDGVTKASAAAALAKTWLTSDTVAASEWVSELPEGPVRNAAATELIEHIYRYDPESAMTWARSINDESDTGERLMIKAFAQWRRFDIEGADAAGKDANIIVLDEATMEKMILNQEQQETEP